MNIKPRIDTTSAEDKSIGFDYQYYYFLDALLNLKSGQTVGLECLDDVHIQQPDGSTLLIQLKHSLQKDTQGKTINLTTMDHDLWKSISNWCKLIIDPSQGRQNKASQLEFLRTNKFLLASNKSKSPANIFLSSLSDWSESRKSYEQLMEDVKSIANKTKDETLKGYIQDFTDLDPSVSKLFLEHLGFILEIDDLIAKCKTSILEKQINPNRVDDLYAIIDSEIRQSCFAAVKNGEKIQINFDEFNRKYRRHFDKVRSDKFRLKEFTPELPATLVDQIFIRQLLDIGDISGDATSQHVKFSSLRLNFIMNLEIMKQEGDIVEDDIHEMNEEAINIWENKFLHVYSSADSSRDGNTSARDILFHLRSKPLTLAQQELPTKASNGAIYELSNIPVLGWANDWEQRYK